MMKKRFNIFTEHKYLFCFFLLIVLALFIGNSDRIPPGDDICYTYHIVDFSLGFISRVLPGQIFVLLFKNPNMVNFRIYSLILFFTAVFFIAYLLEKLYLSAPHEHKTLYCFFICVFCTSGSVLHVFYTEIGMLDAYWIFVLIMFFFFVRSKKMWLLIPICYILMIIINFGAFLCYIPLMSIILLYKAVKSDITSEKKYLIFICVLSAFFAILFFAVLMYNEEHNDALTQEKLHELLISRGSNYFLYYDYAIFKDYHNSVLGKDVVVHSYTLIKGDLHPEFLKTAINRLAYQIYFNYHLTMGRFALSKRFILLDSTVLLSGFPLIAFFHLSFGKFLKKCNILLKKIFIVCSLALFWVTFLGSIILTSDKTRFFHHAIICMFVFFLYLLYEEKDAFADIVSSLLKNNKLYILLFTVAAYLSRFNPYW